MKRWLLRIAGLWVVLALGFGVWARLLAGGPVEFIPGGWIRGESVDQPVEDWTFAADAQYLLVESQARLLPHSTRVWFMVHETKLYILLPALFGDGLQRRIEEDPRVRVGIDGRVYEQRAVAVDGDALVGELMAPILRRTMSAEIGGEVRRPPGVSRLEGATMAIYLLENR